MNNEELINKSENVFFDFFDTIVHRKINEDVVIEMWANSLSAEFKYTIEPEMFYKTRKKAEKIVAKKEKTEEPSYYSIIYELYILLHCMLNNIKFEDFYKCSKKIELDLEKKGLYYDKHCKELIDYALKSRKKIYILSDFYFGKKVVEELLDSVGIDHNIFSDIFVSCDFKKKKKTGNLYKLLIEQKKFVPETCLMIGDNKQSDVLMSNSNGFMSIHMPFSKNERTNIFEELSKISSKYRNMPFANYAFGFYRFIDLIYKQCIKNNYKKLIFLSREGYLLKSLFEIYQNNLDKKILSEYLYVSRYSTFLPSLKKLEEEDFLAVLDQYGDISLKSFLKNLHFNENEVNCVLCSCDNPNQIIKSFGKSNEFKLLIENEKFRQIYDEKVKKEYRCFSGYFRNVVKDVDGPIVLVDVGWKGTMQDNLYKIFGHENDFVGLYYGIFNETGYECSQNLKKGLVFNRFPYKSSKYDIWEFETHLIEQLLVAPHGSTIGYEDCKDGFLPKLEWTDADKQLYYKAEPIQNTIINCFKEICGILNYRCESESAIEKFFVKEQLKAELIISKDMIDFEKIALSEKTNNFGWFDTIPISTSRKQKFVNLLKEIKEIHSDKETKGIIKYLHYFTIKMNAREKYGWKRIVYRLVYCVEKFKV